MLVSAQVFKDWPIASLGGGENAAVSTRTGRRLGAGSAAGSNPTRATAGGASRAAGGPGAAAGSHGSVAGGDRVGATAASKGTTAQQGGPAGGTGGKSGGSGPYGSPQSPELPRP